MGCRAPVRGGRTGWGLRLVPWLLLAVVGLGACGGGCERHGAGAGAEASSSAGVQHEGAPVLEGHRVGEGDGLLVVLLHGFGAPGDDLVGLARSLDVPEGTRFALPEAPLEVGGGGRAWWPLDRRELLEARRSGQPRDLADRHPEGLAEARAAVLRFVNGALRERGLNMSQLVLAGFSQGAMLALDVALHAPEAPAAVAVLSGAPLAMDRWGPRMRQLEGVPVLVTHGRRDGLLSFEASERLAERLGAAGADVRWAPFGGGHAIPPPARQAFSGLITEISSE